MSINEVGTTGNSGGGGRHLNAIVGIFWILTILLTTTTFSPIQGGCEFKKSWTGHWFQNGVLNLFYINATYMETKGECYEEQGDKYLIYDRNENCYRCLAIHEKHESVLQYKETFCENIASLQEMCYRISGDAQLFSMFRKFPEPKPVPCPFKGAPFTFSYYKGFGDCNNPPSKAESCTDDSRLVLKYQACPDVPSTESNVEELICLATWKEGSTRYLVGRVLQGNRRTSDEDQYRCFIYQRSSEKGRTVYNIAQSGDATCSSVQNALEGSKTMKFTTVDDHHNRCKFPIWITDHHTWLSLDHGRTYRFSQRNATLKIMDERLDGLGLKPHPQPPQQPSTYFGFEEYGLESQDQRATPAETRVVCHAILEAQEQKKVQIVAHITAGCDSGYVCMVFYKRDTNIIEIQQSEQFVENPDEACANFDPHTTPYTTLITTTLHPKKCPHLGRFTVINSKRKKRHEMMFKNDHHTVGMNDMIGAPSDDCFTHDYEALAVGCGNNHEMEFKLECAQQTISAYICHGSWSENDKTYVVASPVARRSNDALRYCFVYHFINPLDGATNDGDIMSINNRNNQMIKKQTKYSQNILNLSGMTESCHRKYIPNLMGNWALNFTTNGTCTENDSDNSIGYKIYQKSKNISIIIISMIILFITTAYVIR